MSMPNYKTIGGGYDAPSSNPDLAMAGLVYKVTHENDKYLSYMKRSFISFSYGGRNIEEFNLVATITNNSLSRNGYASFEDITSSYEILDGQLHWGTHYTTNGLDLTLSTDGITQMDLDEFLMWFSPGKSKELILAEHPNRAIMARIGDTPKIELLPFELKIKVKIGGEEYETSTTMYKGDILINFVMDDPFWYSLTNIFGYMDENEVYHDTWTDANGNPTSVYDNPDVFKIVAEDGVPISSMIQSAMLLGNNIFAKLENDEASIIALPTASLINLTKDTNDNSITLEVIIPDMDTLTAVLKAAGGNTLSEELIWRMVALTKDTDYSVNQNNTPDEIYAKLLLLVNATGGSTYVETTTKKMWYIYPRSIIATVDDNTGAYISGARIAGPYISATTGINSLGAGETCQFYYAGTAPSYPLLKFELTPAFENYFISIPKNTYVDETHPYNTITIKSTTELKFMFTTPNVYTSYNLVIKIFNTLVLVDLDWEAIRQQIRTNVNHYRVREWAMRVIDSLDSSTNNYKVISGDQEKAKLRMSCMFRTKNNNNCLTSQFIFDSKTGNATGIMFYRIYSENDPINTNDNWLYDVGTISSEGIEENVGDMVRSNYLIIRDRNYPDTNGYISVYKNDSASTLKNSHILYHDVEGVGLQHVFIIYKNMYL